MHKPLTHRHTAKHTSAAKHHAHAKHAPTKRREVHHHVSAQHAAGKSPQKHKPRKLSYGISCSLEALADTAPFLVTDSDILALYALTPKTEAGILIKDALESAAIHGLAGHRPVFRESDPRPGCIVGMTLPEGTHAAVMTHDGIIMWGDVVPEDALSAYVEESWSVTWPSMM